MKQSYDDQVPPEERSRYAPLVWLFCIIVCILVWIKIGQFVVKFIESL